MKPNYSTMNDGCEEDHSLAEALGEGFTVLYEDYDAMGWGHHSANAVFRASDGRYIHAECGGCSCHGFGSWRYCDSGAEAMTYIPEQERPQ